MDRYRYLVLNQQGVLGLGVLQVACAGLCVVCGFIDAAFRKTTALSSTRTPVWGGLITAVPGVLALLASQRKNPTLVSCMVVSAILSCVAVVMVSVYSCVTLSYGEEEEEVFYHHHSPDVETLVPQTDPYTDTELCAWQGGDDVRLFNCPAGSTVDREEEAPPTLPAYSRLT